MLVRLTSSTSGEIIMFAKHAHAIFERLGKAGVARGVFTTEQLPSAIDALQCIVDEEKMAEKLRTKETPSSEKEATGDENADKRDEESDETITIGQRAMPLIRMMKWTLKEKGFITWEAPEDF